MTVLAGSEGLFDRSVSIGRRDGHRLRRRVRELMRELEIRPPLDIEDLCRRFGTLRGREIVLETTETMPMTLAYAMWIRVGDGADRLMIQQRTSPVHRRHLVLHELGHIIAGHEPDAATSLAGLMPNLSPELVAAVLRRHAYDTRQEHEAEYIASTILRWSADLELLPVQPVDAPAAADRALTDGPQRPRRRTQASWKTLSGSGLPCCGNRGRGRRRTCLRNSDRPAERRREPQRRER